MRKLQLLIAAAAFSVALGAKASAQDTSAHKPGGLNKVAHNVSNTAKKAGRDTKAEAKRDASKTHEALTDAGNGTKSTLKKATGSTGSTDPNHKPGGVNKLARDVSHASKKTGAQVKHATKKEASDAHNALTKSGKAAKDSLKP